MFNKFLCDFFFFLSCDRISFSVLFMQQTSKNPKPFRESVFVFFDPLLPITRTEKDNMCQDSGHHNKAWFIHYPSMVLKVKSKSVQQDKPQNKMLYMF